MVCNTKTFTPKRKEHKFTALKNRNLKTELKGKANIHKTLFKFKKIFDKSRIELLVKIFTLPENFKNLPLAISK